ncbi:MAG: biopolymer transporter ExbD [Sterolibacterium sp.]|jgi:biopolymer transport protein ExbD|nr:biopolymer transporter ExbD [Sterolibacterium sp.]
MAMTLGSGSGSDEDQEIAAINTTPLVDVMLVLLIIFLITIPVVVQTVPVQLPKETNLPTQTKPENIIISVSREGDTYWNMQEVSGMENLVTRLKEVSVLKPQPEIHIRGDQDGRYEGVGKVVLACQRAGIQKIAFITEPPARGG